MRFSTIVPVALAVAPALVAADPGFLGFSLGDKKADGTCKFQADYESDFDTIKTGPSTIVRIYAASDCNTAQQILPAAQSKGFKVVLGVWPDTDESFQADTGALATYVPQYPNQVYAVTVGSETLYRGNFTGSQLLDKITAVKKIVGPNVKVGTADSWNKYQDGTADAVISSPIVEILLANAFSYWQGFDINSATSSFFDDIQQALARIQSVRGSTGDLEFWVGETGWPTGGSTYQNAVPGIQSAQTYFKSAICGIKAWGTNVFVFEAFDEPWKPLSTGQDGQVADETHWGVWNADRSTKYDFSC